MQALEDLIREPVIDFLIKIEALGEGARTAPMQVPKGIDSNQTAAKSLAAALWINFLSCGIGSDGENVTQV